MKKIKKLKKKKKKKKAPSLDLAEGASAELARELGVRKFVENSEKRVRNVGDFPTSLPPSL